MKQHVYLQELEEGAVVKTLASGGPQKKSESSLWETQPS